MGLARWVFKQNQLLRSCKSSKYQMAIRGGRFSGSSNILKIAPFDTLLEKGKRKGVEICATLPIWGGFVASGCDTSSWIIFHGNQILDPPLPKHGRVCPVQRRQST